MTAPDKKEAERRYPTTETGWSLERAAFLDGIKFAEERAGPTDTYNEGLETAADWLWEMGEHGIAETIRDFKRIPGPDERAALAASGPAAGVSADDVIAWLKKRPGASWVATIADIENVVTAIDWYRRGPPAPAGADRERVIEECARIAEAEALGEAGLFGLKNGIWAVHDGACLSIARAIRALASEAGPTEGER